MCRACAQRNLHPVEPDEGLITPCACIAELWRSGRWSSLRASVGEEFREAQSDGSSHHSLARPKLLQQVVGAAARRNRLLGPASCLSRSRRRC
jgi:hypothetical protein